MHKIDLWRVRLLLDGRRYRELYIQASVFGGWLMMRKA